MKSNYPNLLILFFILLVLEPQRVFGISQPKVIFSEIMWMGSSTSSADEWVELYNTTDNNIDLSGWQITNLKNGQESLMLEINSGVIPRKGYFLIANGAKDKNYSAGPSTLNINPDLISSTVSLSNTNFQLKLYDGKWNDSRLAIDLAGNGNAPLSGNNNLKISMERFIPVTGGELAESWINATIRENLDADCSDIANPHNSGQPEITNFSINPLEFFLSYQEKKNIFLSATVVDEGKDINPEAIVVDLSNFGQSDPIRLYDDGSHGDLASNDYIFSASYWFILKNPRQEIGSKEIFILVKDKNNFTSQENTNLKIYQLSDQVIINEFLPHPLNGVKEEFIELYNRGNYPVNLYNWSLDDQISGGSKLWKISDSEAIIEPQNYKTFYNAETKISLNDQEDFVSLFSSNGEHLNMIYYQQAPKNQSYSYNNYQWSWTILPTANLSNMIKSEVLIDDKANRHTQIKINQSVIKEDTSERLLVTEKSKTTSANIGQIKQKNSSGNNLQGIINNFYPDISKLEKIARWIKINQYVIIFTNVICIIWLGFSLWKPSNYLEKQ